MDRAREGHGSRLSHIPARTSSVANASSRYSGLGIHPLKAASLRAQEMWKRQSQNRQSTAASRLSISNPTLIESSLDEERLGQLRDIADLKMLQQFDDGNTQRRADLRQPAKRDSQMSRSGTEKGLPALPR
jgi:hypothetical protein